VRRERDDAVRLCSGGAAGARQGVDRSQHAVLDPPASATRCAEPVGCVKCTDTRQWRVETRRAAARREPHVIEAWRNERIGEDLHRSPPKCRPIMRRTHSVR
jgi:hypothetical protein